VKPQLIWEIALTWVGGLSGAGMIFFALTFISNKNLEWVFWVGLLTVTVSLGYGMWMVAREGDYENDSE